VHIHILGSSAGGGLPQWNCNCSNCQKARTLPLEFPARTQSSVVVSSDGEHWVLLNASPDVRTQLQNFPPLHPPKHSLRGTSIRAIVLTNADIDHCLGLLILREGGAPAIYCTERVRETLTQHFPIFSILGSYGNVVQKTLGLESQIGLFDREDQPTGILVKAFDVPGKPPPYVPTNLVLSSDNTLLPPHREGDTIGLFVSSTSSGTLVYLPGVRDLSEELLQKLLNADLVLIDGTCFTDNELIRQGFSQKTALQMGHAALSGEHGLLSFLSRLPSKIRKVLVHINNTNPILEPGNTARLEAERAGVEIATDGMNFRI